MKRVTGIGGIFFKAKDHVALRQWYQDHLGIESHGEGGAFFVWREDDSPEKQGMTTWSAFPEATKYFEPSSSPFMINYRVANLEWLLTQLREAGVTVDPKGIQDEGYGRFAWIMDPEGNRIELWEPAPE
jgi:predicted enzyme related to lactoylglutathione lyase